MTEGLTQLRLDRMRLAIRRQYRAAGYDDRTARDKASFWVDWFCDQYCENLRIAA